MTCVVHWRFEETNCRGHPLGLCFRRCTDGALMSNGRASDTWNNMTLEGTEDNGKTGLQGVYVSREDVSGAIYDRAVQHGMHNVYLATDGWLRGPVSASILKWVCGQLQTNTQTKTYNVHFVPFNPIQFNSTRN